MYEGQPLPYEAYVNYDLIDPFKIACQNAALSTGKNIERFEAFGLRVSEITRSRGESAYRLRVQSLRALEFQIANVVEGIGSKSAISQQARDLGEKLRIADEAKEVLGRSFYFGAGIDNGATILNDLSSSGATPVIYHVFLAAGSSEWYHDEERMTDFANGNKYFCDLTGSSWGGGESQSLVDVVYPDQVVLAGAGMGFLFPEHTRYPSEDNIKPGQRIVLLETDNPQTNGYSSLRLSCLDTLSQRMGLNPLRRNDAYTYDIGNGQTYGEAILKPSQIVSPIMDSLLLDPTNPVPIEYAVHISGHAWKKIMRPEREFTYVFDRIPELPPIFQFIEELSGMDKKTLYSTFNNGAYYALFVEPQHVKYPFYDDIIL